MHSWVKVHGAVPCTKGVVPSTFPLCVSQFVWPWASKIRKKMDPGETWPWLGPTSKDPKGQTPLVGGSALRLGGRGGSVRELYFVDWSIHSLAYDFSSAPLTCVLCGTHCAVQKRNSLADQAFLGRLVVSLSPFPLGSPGQSGPQHANHHQHRQRPCLSQSFFF